MKIYEEMPIKVEGQSRPKLQHEIDSYLVIRTISGTYLRWMLSNHLQCS